MAKFFKEFSYKGIIATAFTPFNDDEDHSLNLSVIPDYAEYFKSFGYGAVLLNGTYGEGMSMTSDERIEVANAWSEAVKNTGQQLIIQVGGTNLRDVKKLSRHAQSINADALLCLPELYYKPATVKDLIDYLNEIAGAAPATPIIYYHSPKATNITLSMSEFLAEAQDRLPTLAGLKFASTDLEDGFRVLRAAGDRFCVIVATNHALPAWIAMGIDTFMPTAVNIKAEAINAIYKLAASGNLESVKKAWDEQKCLSDYLDKLAAFNNGVLAPVMKQLMNNSAIKVGPQRKPWTFI